MDKKHSFPARDGPPVYSMLHHPHTLIEGPLKINIIIHCINRGRPDHDLIPFAIANQVFVIGME